jgi:HEAT repeat protein
MEEEVSGQLRTLVAKMPEDHRAELAEDVRAVERAGGRTFQGLLELLGDPDQTEDLRVLAAWILGRLHRQEAVTDLLSTLCDPSVRMQVESMLSLALLRNELAVPELIKRARTAGDVEVRTIAVLALGGIGGKDAHAELRRILKDKGEEKTVRGAAAEQLGQIGDTADVPLLINALKDPADEVRYWSAFGLGQIEDRRALPALRRLARTDEGVLPGRGSIAEEANAAMTRIEEWSEMDGRSD